MLLDINDSISKDKPKKKSDKVSFIIISFQYDFDDNISKLKNITGIEPDDITIISDRSKKSDNINFYEVRSASALTDMNIKINRALEKSEGNIFILFDNITTIINYINLRKTYRFLNVIQGSFKDYNVNESYFLINKKAHSDKELSTIKVLFN